MWVDYIRAGIFPARCVLCGAAGTKGADICTPCLHDLPHNHHCCHLCALPLPPGHEAEQICGKCLKQAPRFDRCHSPYSYGYPISSLISEFKFNGKLHIGRLLSDLLISSIEQHKLDLPDLIMPVPLHTARLRERGFNQALELARPISLHFGIPLDTKSCQRVKTTRTQSTLDKKIRIKNMRGAFKVIERIDCEHLVLIDDVVTTGATVNELANALKRTGVKRVDVWALARTP